MKEGWTPSSGKERLKAAFTPPWTKPAHVRREQRTQHQEEAEVVVAMVGVDDIEGGKRAVCTERDSNP